jgi:hypothetical protein
VAIAVDAAQLSRGLADGELARIAVRITRQTSLQTQLLVSEFWRRLGYIPEIDVDHAELPR